MADIIENVIKPEWEEIQRVRDECHDHLRGMHLSGETTDAVTMVINELLENALKYGNYDNPDARITYKLLIDKNNIIMEVTNPIFDDDDTNFRLLDKTIQWIRGYQNPFEAYVEKLREVSIRPIDNRESGIGLVRAAYEGQSIIDFYIRDDNRISVSAVYQLH